MSWASRRWIPWKLINPAKFDRVRAIADARERRAEWRKLNWETGATNLGGAIDAGDLLLAVLDGSDVDSGTAAEIGYGFATGKPIIGYRSDLDSAATTRAPWSICRSNISSARAAVKSSPGWKIFVASWKGG